MASPQRAGNLSRGLPRPLQVVRTKADGGDSSMAPAAVSFAKRRQIHALVGLSPGLVPTETLARLGEALTPTEYKHSGCSR